MHTYVFFEQFSLVLLGLWGVKLGLLNLKIWLLDGTVREPGPSNIALRKLERAVRSNQTSHQRYGCVRVTTSDEKLLQRMDGRLRFFQWFRNISAWFSIDVHFCPKYDLKKIWNTKFSYPDWIDWRWRTLSVQSSVFFRLLLSNLLLLDENRRFVARSNRLAFHKPPDYVH